MKDARGRRGEEEKRRRGEGEKGRGGEGERGRRGDGATGRDLAINTTKATRITCPAQSAHHQGIR